MKHTYRYSQNGLYHAIESKPIKLHTSKPVLIKVLDFLIVTGLLLALAYILSYVMSLGFHNWVNWIISLV